MVHQGPRSILQIEGAKTFLGVKYAENQEQSDFLYGFQYILEIICGAVAPSAPHLPRGVWCIALIPSDNSQLSKYFSSRNG